MPIKFGTTVLDAFKSPPVKGICSEDNLRTHIQILMYTLFDPAILLPVIYLFCGIYPNKFNAVLFFMENKEKEDKL